MRLTVGPLPPAVYWRRRAIVLGATLLALFLVAQACMSASASRGDSAAGDGSPTGTPTASPDDRPATPDPTGSPATTPTASPTTTPAGRATSGSEQDGAGGAPSPTPPDPDVCTDEEMRIIAEASEPYGNRQVSRVAVGDEVRFTIVIENGSDRSCRRDVGGGQRELWLRQGEAAVKLWSSRDCVDLTGENVRQLGPDFATQHWTLWRGRTSDQCDENGNPAGKLLSPGEYELVARLGTAKSEPVAITLT